MAKRTRHATDIIKPVTREVPIGAIAASIEHRQSVCDLLERLADDVCGPRSRQAASQILDFMSGDRFGVPDDHVSGLLSALHDGFSIHPILDELSEVVDRDPRAARRLERSATKGLEAIVLGRIPENPLDFILAAFSLVELERRYLGIVVDRLMPLALTEPSLIGWFPVLDSVANVDTFPIDQPDLR